MYFVLPDVELVRLLKLGDEAAFTEIFNRYWKKLLVVAGNKTNDLTEAEEIVQDIFLSLWNRRKEIALTGALNNYLATAVKYRVIKFLAKKNQQYKYENTIEKSILLLDNSTQEWLDFEALKTQLSVLVADLPEKCRIVYQLSRNEGLSQKQIAAQLCISEKTVEAHLGKAIKIIKTNLHYCVVFVFF